MSDAELVVIGAFTKRIDAEMAQGALQAADIESFISADDAGGQYSGVWMDAVRLLVRSEDAGQAHQILGSSD